MTELKSMSLHERKQRQYKILFVASMFVLFYILANLFSRNTDDWFYMARGDLSLSLIVDEIIQKYNTLNGRVLGNTLAFLFIRQTPVSALVIAGTATGIGVLIGKLSRVNTVQGYMLIFTIILTLPFLVFAQAFVWASGFYNYALPVLLLLLYFYLVRDFFTYKQVKLSAKNIILSFLLGVSIQLFVESMTVVVLLIAIMMFVWHLIRFKKISIVFSSFTLGSVLGTVIMFSSPALANLASGSDWYRSIPTTFSELIMSITTNMRLVTGYYLLYNYLIWALIAIPLFYLVYKIKTNTPKEKDNRAGLFVLLIGSNAGLILLYVLLQTSFATAFPEGYSIISVIIYIFWGVTLLHVLNKTIHNKYVRTTAIFFFLSSVLSVIPILFVNPIGPRCFFVSSVLLSIFAMRLVSYCYKKYKIKVHKGIKIAVALAPYIAMAVLLFVHGVNHKIEQDRMEHMQWAVKNEQKVIELPSYEYPQFLHFSNSPDWAFLYYIDEPYDISANYISYNKWRAKYYNDDGSEKMPDEVGTKKPISENSTKKQASNG